MNLIPDAPCFPCVPPDAHCSQFLYSLTLECTYTSCFHSVRVPEKGISHDPQHSSNFNFSSFLKNCFVVYLILFFLLYFTLRIETFILHKS